MHTTFEVYLAARKMEELIDPRIQELEAQVLALEKKLGELHDSDINALRRANKTLQQHIQALDVETKHLATLVEQMELTFLTPEFVASEVGVVAAAASSVWAVDRAMRMLHLPLVGTLTQVAVIAVAGVVGWRLLRRSGSHVSGVLYRNRTTHKRLKQDWQVVRQRIDTMVQLTKQGMP